MKLISSLALAGILALGLSACKKPEGPQAQVSAVAPAVHSSTGVIKGIRENGKIFVIEHKEFPGFMEAMTMGFELKDPAMGQGLKVGDKIEFSIEAQGDAFPVTHIKKLP